MSSSNQTTNTMNNFKPQQQQTSTSISSQQQQSSSNNDPIGGPGRRSSSRTIKRKKFDDELVDSMSSSYPKHQLFLHSNHETSNNESIISEQQHTSEIIPSAVATTSSTSTVSELPESSQAPQPIAIKKIKEKVRTPTPTNVGSGNGGEETIKIRKKKSRKQCYIPKQYIEENNFWKPTDDLALIINVEQTMDLKKVYDGVKFSNKFSYQDIESRWRTLLYDNNVKSLSLCAIRQLHSDIYQSIQSQALFSDAEENLLKKIESRKEPTLESLQELINNNADVFLPSRTPKILLKHWKLLRHYSLLIDQSLQPLSRHESVISFSEMENIVKKEVEEEMKNPELLAAATSDCDIINQEVIQNIRKNILEIRMLENEIPKYQALLDSITGMTPSDFDNQTYAVLRGRLVRYLMRSTEITIGRITKDFVVDVDLSLEGPSTTISRLQAVINLQSTGEFIVSNTGKHPIYIDSKPVLANNSAQIHHNSLIEFSSLKFIFLINQDLISKIRNDVLLSCK